MPANQQISFEGVHRFLKTLFAEDLHIAVGTPIYAPPAQIRTCAIHAYGSHLGCLTTNRCSATDEGFSVAGASRQRSCTIRAQLGPRSGCGGGADDARGG